MNIELLEKTLSHIDTDNFKLPGSLSSLNKNMQFEYGFNDDQSNQLVKTWIKLGVMIDYLKVIQPTAIQGCPMQINLYYFPKSHQLNKEDVGKDIIFDFYVSYIDRETDEKVDVGLGSRLIADGGENANKALTLIKKYLNDDKKSFLEAFMLNSKIGSDIDNVLVMTILGFNNFKNTTFSVGDFNFLTRQNKMPPDVRNLLLNNNTLLEKIILEMDVEGVDFQGNRKHKI